MHMACGCEFPVYYHVIVGLWVVLLESLQVNNQQLTDI
jgi:hypothetical protein